jgi:YD repeat-containing protein
MVSMRKASGMTSFGMSSHPAGSEGALTVICVTVLTFQSKGKADQLTRETVGGTVTTYLYDPNGNLTKKDDGTNVHAYGYDSRNLMTDYDGPGANNDATYKYDASDPRVQKTVGGSTTTRYYHDGQNVVAEYNGSNQLQRTYVTPGLDQNLSLTASGSTYYYLSDALGSIRQVLDADEPQAAVDSVPDRGTAKRDERRRTGKKEARQGSPGRKVAVVSCPEEGVRARGESGPSLFP